MNTLFQLVLAIILSLARYLPQDQAERMAHAISATAETRQDAAMMLTVSFYETGFRSTPGVIPFGLSGAPGACRVSLLHCAEVSRNSLRRASFCSTRMERVFGRYHTGRCAPDPYSIREARTYQRIYERL